MKTLILFLVLTPGLLAQEISLPTNIKTSPGRLVPINVTTNGSIVRWASPEDCDLIPFPDGRTAIFSSMVPGKYRILAWTAKDNVPSQAAVCVVTVEGSAPTPPGPGDPFRMAVQNALKADNASASEREVIYNFYNSTAPGITGGLSFKLLSEFQSELRQRNVLPSTAIPLTRKLIAQEFTTTFGAQDRAFTQEDKVAAQQLFLKLAAALK